MTTLFSKPSVSYASRYSMPTECSANDSSGGLDYLCRTIYRLRALLVPSLENSQATLGFSLRVNTKFMRRATDNTSSAAVRFHAQIFIDRPHDIEVADPTFYTKITRYLRQEVRSHSFVTLARNAVWRPPNTHESPSCHSSGNSCRS